MKTEQEIKEYAIRLIGFVEKQYLMGAGSRDALEEITANEIMELITQREQQAFDDERKRILKVLDVATRNELYQELADLLKIKTTTIYDGKW